MSMNFDRPLTDEQQQVFREFMGDRVEAMDKSTALLNTRNFVGSEMSDLARKLNQVVTLEMNEPGEIKTLSDGSRYQVTPEGWRKL